MDLPRFVGSHRRLAAGAALAFLAPIAISSLWQLFGHPPGSWRLVVVVAIVSMLVLTPLILWWDYVHQPLVFRDTYIDRQSLMPAMKVFALIGGLVIVAGWVLVLSSPGLYYQFQNDAQRYRTIVGFLAIGAGGILALSSVAVNSIIKRRFHRL